MMMKLRVPTVLPGQEFYSRCSAAFQYIPHAKFLGIFSHSDLIRFYANYRTVAGHKGENGSLGIGLGDMNWSFNPCLRSPEKETPVPVRIRSRASDLEGLRMRVRSPESSTQAQHYNPFRAGGLDIPLPHSDRPAEDGNSLSPFPDS